MKCPLYMCVLWWLCIAAADGSMESSSIASSRKKVKSRGHLVVHVGPHKTGTSTLQAFLSSEHEWIHSTFKVRVGARGKKRGSNLATTLGGNKKNTSYNETETRQTIDEIRLWLAAGETVMISSEGFDNMHNYGALDAVANLSASTTFVHVHRAEVDWIRSCWEQGHKQSSNPGPFLAMLSNTPSFLPLGYTLVSNLKAVQDRQGLKGRVIDIIGVSMEGLSQNGTSTASFFICEATLRLEGAKRVACRNTIDARLSFYRNKNISPPPAAIDTVRLARHAAHILGCPVPTFTSSSEEVVKVAMQLPMTCPGNDDGAASATESGNQEGCNSALSMLQGAFDREWFGRLGIPPPPTQPCVKPLCSVDEPRLGPKHWNLIRSLLVC